MLLDNVVHCIENKLRVVLEASLEDVHFPVGGYLDVSAVIAFLVPLTSSHQNTILVDLDLILIPIRHVVNVEL